jgi:thermostable 8-oxoguanine DNA glycosylase
MRLDRAINSCHAIHNYNMHYMKAVCLQRVIGEFNGRYQFLELPDPWQPLMDALRWGAFDHPLTPAFWVSQAWMAGQRDAERFRLGKSLVEEVIYCLLGGYGIPAEVGVAAAERVCDALAEAPDLVLGQKPLEQMLSRPLTLRGRAVRYRFAAQRAKYLSGALEMLPKIDDAALGDVELRNALLALPGVGPKTASWIVRNRRGSDEVAILDVHIVRACRIMNIFPSSAEPAKHYGQMERRFLSFCTATGSPASSMDAVMWKTMRAISPKLMQQLVDVELRLREVREDRRAGGVL